ncbi:MAG: hypothetical protein ACI96N_003350 [Arenicella sp.]|jgi:hypothetical protein
MDELHSQSRYYQSATHRSPHIAHFHASCPINFASQTTSLEHGMDKVALPMVSVITVAEGDISNRGSSGANGDIAGIE